MEVAYMLSIHPHTQLCLGQHPIMDELSDTIQRLIRWLDDDILHKSRASKLRAAKVLTLANIHVHQMMVVYASTRIVY